MHSSRRSSSGKATPLAMEKPGLITTTIGIMIDSWAGMFRVIRLGCKVESTLMGMFTKAPLITLMMIG